MTQQTPQTAKEAASLIWKALLHPENKEKELRVQIYPERGGFLPSRRLIKAVFKEKDLDPENRKRFSLRARVEGNRKDIVRFWLLQKINILNV